MPSRTLDPCPLAAATCLFAAGLLSLPPAAHALAAASPDPELVALAVAGSAPRKAAGGLVVDYELVEIFAGEPGRPALPVVHDQLSQEAIRRLESGASVLLLADRDARQRSRWRGAEPRAVSAGLVAALREWSAPPDVRSPRPLSEVLARHAPPPALASPIAVPADDVGPPPPADAPAQRVTPAAAPDPECAEDPLLEPPIPVVARPANPTIAVVAPPAPVDVPRSAPPLAGAREIAIRERPAPVAETLPSQDERLPARASYPIARVRPAELEKPAPAEAAPSPAPVAPPAPSVGAPAPGAHVAAQSKASGSALPPPPPDRLLGPRAEERRDLDRPAWFWIR